MTNNGRLALTVLGFARAFGFTDAGLPDRRVGFCE
jgi:hypothetical protein